ncbi:ABC transporter substrate-binding protein [Micromonospora fulviviridis]|uniref:ABC transporter substrate-binding protein n=1 Tax=Micromonospora fulviviridis TaxID=47860 RepID=UPI00378DC8ED
MTAPRTRNRLRARLAAPAAVLAAGLALAGCSGTASPSTSTPSESAGAGYPVTTSSCGRDHTYDKAPTRVVIGNENSLKTIDALGVSDAVYGYVLGPDDAGKTPAGLPKNLVEVSSTTIPAREPVIAAKPDLFLSYNEAQLTTQGSLSYDDLNGIGANAYVMGAYCAKNPDNRSIDTVYTDVTNLGRIFGAPQKALQLNEKLKDRVAAAKKSLDGSSATVAFLKVAGGKVYAIGGYPVSAILGALGLKNQFADLPTPFAELSTEQALSMKPDVVFVNYVGDEQAAIDELAQALPDLQAMKAGHVYGANESGPQGGGVGIIESLEAIAADVKTATK